MAAIGKIFECHQRHAVIVVVAAAKQASDLLQAVVAYAKYLAPVSQVGKLGCIHGKAGYSNTNNTFFDMAMHTAPVIAQFGNSRLAAHRFNSLYKGVGTKSVIGM